jgi:regulator of protease activity HflC (stomatin/prohibitin superfamily)
MERNIQKIGIVNFIILLIAVGISIVLSLYSNLFSGEVGAVFFGAGFILAWVSYFQMGLEAKEQVERLEYDEITREKNAASLFSTDAETFPAKRSREQFERFFLPGFTVVLMLAQGAAAYFLWRWLDKAIVTPPQEGLIALALYAVLALVLFLLGKYSGNIARFENQRLLKPGASYLVLGAYICAAIAIAIGLQYGGVSKPDYYLARALVVILGLTGIESALNLILEIYRPRVRGRHERLVYESRVLGLMSQPEGIFTTAAHALDYQFGFKVSETWVYRFVERALAWLILVQLVILIVSSCFVFVSPGEEALLERFGTPASANNLLRPGMHLKLPWPVDKIYRFRTDEIQSFTIGQGPEDDHGSTITWSVKHEEEPMNLMVAAKDSGVVTSTNGTPTSSGGVPVDLLTVGIPVQYQIDDVRAYAYNHVDSGKLLEKIATREVTKYLVGVDLFEIMSSGKAKASADLMKAIQDEANRLKLGVKILLVGMEDIHPPQKVVTAFENVVGARQEAQAKIREAEGYAVQTRTLAEGQATKAIREAESFKAETLASAEARANQFKSQMVAFQAAPEVYKNRAYLLPWINSATNARLYIVTSTNTHDVFQVDLQDKINVDLADIPIPGKK